MKKIISLMIVVVIFATMCFYVIPASAATPSIKCPAVVTVDDNMEYSFDVTLSGVPSHDSWIAIFKKSEVELAESIFSEPDDVFSAAGQYGRFFTRKCTSSDGKDLPTTKVADGTKVTLKSDDACAKTWTQMTAGVYTVYLFTSWEKGYEIAAQADFSVVNGWQVFTRAGMRVSSREAFEEYKETDGSLRLQAEDTYHTTYFTAGDKFDAVGFTGWADEYNTQKWSFQIIQGKEEYGEDVVVLRDVKQIVKDGVVTTVKFNPVPAGEYGLRISAIDGYESGKHYFNMPISAILPDADVYTVNNGGVYSYPEPADAVDKHVSAVAFGIRLASAVGENTNNKEDENTGNTVNTDAPQNTKIPEVETASPETTTPNQTVDSSATTPPDATLVSTPTDDAGDKNTSEDKVTAGKNESSDKGKAGDKVEDGLEPLVLTGIIVGGVIVFAGVGIAIYFLVIKKKK